MIGISFPIMEEDRQKSSKKSNINNELNYYVSVLIIQIYNPAAPKVIVAEHRPLTTTRWDLPVGIITR
jgi:hypothetical protein